MRKTTIVIAFGCLAAFAPAAAYAQDTAGAEALFQKGHQLFEEKKYAEACPKFAESFRLDPVTGSLLALAACHDADGKLATAWAEYVDVANRARREGRNDRADAAQARATALEPKLARLTISLAQGADSASDLQVKRDGIVIGSGIYGTPLPVDRGEHTIEATAPGRQSFSKRVTLVDGQKELVAIPLLPEGAHAPAVAPPVTTPAESEQPGDKPKASRAPLRTLGIVAAGAGVVVMGVGGYFGISAIGKNNDSNAMGCAGTQCSNPAAKQKRLDAVDAGNVSSALFVLGSLFVAGGVVLYIVGGKSGGDGKSAVTLQPSAGPSNAGAVLWGRF